jgi:hypothetical protein
MSEAPTPQEHEQDPSEVVIAIEGDVTDYWTYTLNRDYLRLMPGLPDAGLRLYDIFRSMMSEVSRNRPGAGLRRMTIDQLCFLMPGSNGKADKPVSVSAMYELLSVLERLDLIVPKDMKEAAGASQYKGKEKAAKAILRGYVVKDLPPAVYTGWRNTWDKLDAYRPDWRTNPVEPPTHLTAYLTDDAGRQVPHYWVGSLAAIEAFQNSGTAPADEPTGELGEAPNQDPFQDSGTAFQDSGTVVQDSGTDLASTCGNVGSQRSLSKKSFSLSGDGEQQQDQPTQAEASEARETAMPKDNNDQQPAVPQQRQEITEMIRSLPGHPGEADASDLEPLVLEALAAGWTLPQLSSHLARKCDPARVFDPAAVYRKHLKRLPKPFSAGASGAPRKECRDCNGTGFLEDPETFLPAGKCACRTNPAMA